MLKLYLQGKSSVVLGDADFVAEGGEGRIYAQGDLAYKLYADPANMIPAAKLRELAALDRHQIIRPLHALLDRSNRPVGFSMRRVEGAAPLARLFTNDFRNRHGISPDSTLELVEAMRETIRFIHEQGCLIVDGNEMNYLVDERGFTRPFFIDVDSYQTPGFAATALMPSIRDWHTPGFTPLSDWFSFAVVACQLFIGIHPYRGTHPRFKKNDLEGRMQANISIFNKAVSLPPAARNFSHIPGAWLDWFVALFERGERRPPPQTAGGLKALKPVQPITGMGEFVISLVRTFDADIVRIKSWNGIVVAHLRNAIFIGGAIFTGRSADTEVVFSPRSLSPLLVKAEAGLLHVKNGKTGLHLHCPPRAERIMVVDNNLYALHQGDLTEIRINELGDRIILSPGRVWKVLPKAVMVLQSMLYENVLGKAHLLIPFRPGACQRLATPELDGCKIIDGRWDNGVAVVIGYRAGRYDRFVFRFDRAHTHYRLRVEENIDLPAINFATLDNGVSVHLTQEAMEIFSNNPAQDALRIISNPPDAAINLAKDGAVVLCFKDRRLYRLSLNS